MFEGVYKVIKGVFCNICREHLITKYYRVFVVDIAKKTLNHPANPCGHSQCTARNDSQTDELT